MIPNSTSIEEGFVTLISRPVFLKIFFAFVNVIWTSFILLGVIANLINLVVFLKMKLTDSVIISFFALSCSDLAYLLCSGMTTVLLIFDGLPLANDIPINVRDLGTFISWYESIFFDTSIGITTYIAVARCCCVVIAFRFKNSFTIPRTAVYISAIFIASIICRIPLLANQSMVWRTDSLVNKTVMVIHQTPAWTSVLAVHDVLNRTIIPNTALAVVLICMGILIFKLMEASRIRKGMTAVYKYKIQKSPNEELDSSCPNNTKCVNKVITCRSVGNATPCNAVKSGAMGKKEIQVVKAVTLVSSVFVLSVLVMSLKAMAQVLVPGFNVGGRYTYLNIVSSLFSYSVSHFSAGINILIYYSFNSKFRATLLQGLAGTATTA